MNDLWEINTQKPVSHHPLNRGLVSWFLCLPHAGWRGNTWRDLCRRNDAAFSTTNSGSPAAMRAIALRRTSSFTGTDCQPEAFSSPSVRGRASRDVATMGRPYRRFPEGAAAKPRDAHRVA